MIDYDATLQLGAQRYRDVLDLLAASGLTASFTQTGGMNAALEVLLDGGHTLLITDAEDSLAWDREEHHGWGVGLYPPDQANTDGECLAFDSTDDGAPQALPALVPGAAGARRRHPQPARPMTRRPTAARLRAAPSKDYGEAIGCFGQVNQAPANGPRGAA